MTSSRRSSAEPMSLSGIEIRSGSMKRSQRGAGRDHVAPQVDGPEVEREVAALGDGQRFAARQRQLGKDARHLLRRLDVELLGREPEAARVAERCARLDAEERLVGAPVAGLEIVRAVGPDDRRADRLGDRQGVGGDLRLRLEAVGLDFHEVVVAADDLLVPTRDLRRLPHLPLDQEARDLGVETPREDDEPVGVLREELTVHPGLVVEALEVGLRDQLDEISVAGAVPRQDRQVVRALVAAVLGAALLPAPGGDVELAAEDRLDASLLRREIEVDRPEEVAVVRQRDRGQAQILRLLDELLELRGAVEEAVLGVDVEVNELAVLHREPAHSHSMVDGGFEEMSKTTRFTPWTSLLRRLLMRPSRS